MTIHLPTFFIVLTCFTNVNATKYIFEKGRSIGDTLWLWANKEMSHFFVKEAKEC